MEVYTDIYNNVRSKNGWETASLTARD